MSLPRLLKITTASTCVLATAVAQALAGSAAVVDMQRPGVRVAFDCGWCVQLRIREGRHD